MAAAAVSSCDSSQQAELGSSLLSCVACRQTLSSQPVLLPCMHSACSACLRGRLTQPRGSGESDVSGLDLRERLVTCPSCGESSSEGAVRPNHFLAALVRDRQAAAAAAAVQPPLPECSLCSSGDSGPQPAVAHCAECEQTLCAGCLRWHNKFKKRHVVTTLTVAHANQKVGEKERVGDGVGGGGGGGEDGRRGPAGDRAVAAATAAPVLPPCWNHVVGNSDRGSVFGAPQCDSFCRTCAATKCGTCRETCERAGHGVVAAFGTQASEQLAQLAKQSLADAVARLSSLSLTNATHDDVTSAAADSLVADLAHARQADLDRLERNRRAALAAFEETFDRAKDAVQRAYEDVAGRLVHPSTGLASSTSPQRREHAKHVTAYAQLLMASGATADVFEQVPQLTGCVRSLLPRADVKTAAAIDISRLAYVVDVLPEQRVNVPENVVYSWMGLHLPATGLRATDEREEEEEQPRSYQEPVQESEAATCGLQDMRATPIAAATSGRESSATGPPEDTVAASKQFTAEIVRERREASVVADIPVTNTCKTETAPSDVDVTHPITDDHNQDEHDDETKLLLRDSTDLDRSLLTCCLCGLPLTEPVLLACLHSCCSRCLDVVVTETGDATAAQADGKVPDAAALHGYVSCKKCNVSTRLVDTKRNGFVSALLRERRSAAGLIACDPCQTAGKLRQEAEHACAECGQFICNDCLRWHRKFHSRHSVTPIVARSASAVAAVGPAAQQPPAPAVPNCVQHDIKCDLYCTVCDRLKCIRCVKLSCMEAKHDIIVVDGTRSAEHVRSATADMERALSALAEKTAALCVHFPAATGTGSSSSLSQPLVTSPAATDRSESVHSSDGDAQALETIVHDACRRSEEAVMAVYGHLTESVLVQSRSLAELAPLVRHATSYCDLLVDGTPNVTSVLDQRGLTEVCLAKLSAELEALIVAMPPSVDPDTFTVIERQQDGGHVTEPVVPAPGESKHSTTLREPDSGTRPDPAVRPLGEHLTGIAAGSDSKPDTKRGDEEKKEQQEQEQQQEQQTAPQLLLCCVCEHQLDEPVLLKCLHNCCRQCVRKIATTASSAGTGFADGCSADARVVAAGSDEDYVTCPQCHRTTDAASLRLNALAAWHVLDAGRSADAAPPDCKYCLENYNYRKATHFCVDCDAYMCDGCRRRHRKFKSTDEVVPVASVDAVTRVRRPTVCYKHDQKHDLYCVSCSQMRCKSCSGECLQARHEIAAIASPRAGDLCTEVCTAIRQAAARLRAQFDQASGRLSALTGDLDAAKRADARRLQANADRLLISLSAAAAEHRAVVASTDRRMATSGTTTAPTTVAARQLMERSRRVSHYCRSLLTSGGTANILDQRTLAVACLMTLCTAADNLLPAAATALPAQLSSALIGDAIGGSSSSDALARYQRWIGVPRADAGEFLSQAAAAARPASSGLSLSSAESTASESLSRQQPLSVGSGSSGQQSSVASEASKGASSLHLQDSGGSGSAAINRIDDGASLTADDVILNEIQTEAASDDSLLFVADTSVGGSFTAAEDCRDLAVTSDGRVLLALLWKGLEEYEWASGKRLGAWKPPACEEGADCLSTVHVLEDDTIVVGLVNSQSVALLRRRPRSAGDGGGDTKPPDGDDDGGWVLGQQFMLRAGPWCVCGRGDVLATAGARDVLAGDGRHWLPGPYLDLTQRSDGNLLLCVELGYDIQALTVTGRAIIVLSCEAQPRDGRQFHLVEAYDYRGQRLWYTDSGGATDTCPSPGGSTLYLAQPHGNRVRAIGTDDGHVEGDALSHHDRGLRAPFRIALTSAVGARTVAIAVLSRGEGCTYVNVYPARSGF